MPSSSSSSGGPLIKVAYGRNLPEAEMIQGLLAERGIPCLLRSMGVGSPYDLAAGARQIFVTEELAERAREILEGTPGGD